MNPNNPVQTTKDKNDKKAEISPTTIPGVFPEPDIGTNRAAGAVKRINFLNAKTSKNFPIDVLFYNVGVAIYNSDYIFSPGGIMKTSTIIMIQIKGSDKQARQESPDETANYLSAYYKTVMKIISPLKWRLIKTMGDGLLISAETGNSPEHIERIYKTISEKYNIELKYRKCDFIERKVKIGSYSCLDVFGKDINNLFRCDSSTVKWS